jgi:hypothetical protein
MISTRRGFIAINRGIFDHWIARSPKRFKAWQWLIAEAAHAPQGRRGTWGVVHVERGQIATSIRILARQWRWPKSNVARLLKRLAADGMIETKKGTAKASASSIGLGHEITILTICNYNQFQAVVSKRKPSQGLEAVRQTGLQTAQQLPFIEEFATQPNNHLTIESRGASKKEAGEVRTVHREKPFHGAKGKGVVWFDHKTDEWNLYAQDFKDVRGVSILPENRYGGLGNWFILSGEASRRKRRA